MHMPAGLLHPVEPQHDTNVSHMKSSINDEQAVSSQNTPSALPDTSQHTEILAEAEDKAAALQQRAGSLGILSDREEPAKAAWIQRGKQPRQKRASAKMAQKHPSRS